MCTFKGNCGLICSSLKCDVSTLNLEWTLWNQIILLKSMIHGLLNKGEGADERVLKLVWSTFSVQGNWT